MVLIFNKELSVTISPEGAELQSIIHNHTGLEYLWSGDPAFWNRKSPVLFPVVGGLKNNSYSYNGQRYHLGRHGFARDLIFDIVAQSKEQVSFRLTDTEATRKLYPFHFKFTIDYRLEADRLRVIYQVENSDSKEMLFSLGAHPAFKVPLAQNTNYEDYYLLFDEEENTGIWPITPSGDIAATPTPYLNRTRTLPLKKSLFYNDALVFKKLRSRVVSLKSDRTPSGITVNFDGFPYMGIWAAKEADFVCIEPWCGLGDSELATGELADKEGINRLPPGERFEREWSARFYAH